MKLSKFVTFFKYSHYVEFNKREQRSFEKYQYITATHNWQLIVQLQQNQNGENIMQQKRTYVKNQCWPRRIHRGR